MAEDTVDRAKLRHHGDVDARRYFCDTCHVVQMDVEPRVANRFEDVDAIVRRQQAERARAQKR